MESDDKTDARLNLQTLQITPEVLAIIAEIDEFKGAWRAVGRVAPDRLTSLRRVAAIESIASSTRIEGSALSDREVERLLSRAHGSLLATRDEQEVAGYAEVAELVFEQFEAIDLTENVIKQLHENLLKFSDKDERHRGGYKTISNNIEAFSPEGESLGIVFATATPFDTPRRMTELVEWTRIQLDDRRLHPLIVVAVFAVVFLEIHPFQDGNGRLSRILTNLLLLRTGYSFMPFCSFERIVEERKERYYLALRRTQTTIRSSTPDWMPWVRFFLESLLTHKRQLEQRIEEELRIMSPLPDLSLKILERVQTAGRVTVAEASRMTGVSRNTIKDHLRALVEAGILVRHGAGRGTWYALS